MNCSKPGNKFAIIAGRTYAITLNPNDSSQAFDTRFTPAARWKYVTDKFIERLKQVTSFTFELYFEVSTPDHYNVGHKTRIHAHGFINIHDLTTFLLSEINQLADWCDIKIKELTIEEGYKQYCIKMQDDLAALHPLYYSSQMIEIEKKKEKQKENQILQNRFRGSRLSID